ncbi:GspH/FimT family pseudopilin [Scleromatobacter humisilvae]|uniref:Type II secretion system protein H n=1 Tax=Scleromatobacter humisilvae TaxID=2897159 RepID=A0A9X1YLB4_9BURK|nr:GspH/FimT family pseudopilin [Scleromatobacter humisilvae]MCK9687837.1 GspH/FimT family pseudopilin [Scleromatobacter humisilvae]
MSIPSLCPRRRPAPGFTLIELAIVLAIVAILLRVAAPGMSRSVAARALAAQSSEFMAALRFARATAMQRGMVVTMCASLPGGPPLACQGPHAADWHNGWIVFADRDRHGTPDASTPLLRVQQALLRSGGVAGTRGSISFTAAGYSTDAASHFLFSPPAEAALDAPPAVMVCVSKQGRPRLAGTGACD